MDRYCVPIHAAEANNNYIIGNWFII